MTRVTWVTRVTRVTTRLTRVTRMATRVTSCCCNIISLVVLYNFISSKSILCFCCNTVKCYSHANKSIYCYY